MHSWASIFILSLGFRIKFLSNFVIFLSHITFPEFVLFMAFLSSFYLILWCSYHKLFCSVFILDHFFSTFVFLFICDVPITFYSVQCSYWTTFSRRSSFYSFVMFLSHIILFSVLTGLLFLDVRPCYSFVMFLSHIILFSSVFLLDYCYETIS